MHFPAPWLYRFPIKISYAPSHCYEPSRQSLRGRGQMTAPACNETQTQLRPGTRRTLLALRSKRAGLNWTVH